MSAAASSRLAGRRALVTGGASGIGAAVARRLSTEGARVVVADLDGEAAVAAAAALDGDAIGLAVDVARTSDVVAALTAVDEAWGGLDVLVNNAGIGAAGTVVETDDDELDRLLAVNVRGTFAMMRHAVPLLRRGGGGVIVNVASIAALVGLPGRAAYSATKGAIYALTRAAAIDHVGEGIRINCVAPGTVETPWVGRIVAQTADPAAELERMRARQPHGRLVQPEEIAGAVAYLASDDAASTVGECLVVDGGATAR